MELPYGEGLRSLRVYMKSVGFAKMCYYGASDLPANLGSPGLKLIG